MKVSWVSPSAWRIRSRSRAVFSVLMKGSSAPLTCSHRAV